MLLVRNPHVATLLGAFLPAPRHVWRYRSRCELRDGDFLDLDVGGSLDGASVAVLVHGLEGSSQSGYLRSLAARLCVEGITPVGCNLRGCSGEVNRKPFLYHSGMIEDLAEVVGWCRARGAARVALVGFSLGGNLVLNFVSRSDPSALEGVRAAVAVAAPCDVAASADALDAPSCWLYRRFFFRLLRKKLAVKAGQFRGLISFAGYEEIDSFWEYDHRYTAPLHGFASVEEFYRQVSSLPHLPKVQVPTLMLGASDDPFLGLTCFPTSEKLLGRQVTVNFDELGGHVGSIERQGFGLRRGLDGRITFFLSSRRL